MSLSSMRNELSRIKQSMPPAASTEGAAERNARRLASIAATPEGAKRDVSIVCLVHAASGIETDEGYAALLDAIGTEAIERAFQGDAPPKSHGSAFVRARARAYRPTGGTVNPLEIMIDAAIKKRNMAAELAAEAAS